MHGDVASYDPLDLEPDVLAAKTLGMVLPVVANLILGNEAAE